MFKQLVKGSSSKKRNEDEDIKMEEFIDVEQQIEKFKKEKLELIPAKCVYKLSKVHKKQYLFKHYGEQMIRVTHEDEKVELNLIDRESYNYAVKEHLKMTHLGLIVVGVKALTRENLGTKVFVCLYDDRFNDVEQSILDSYELDINLKGGIVYFTPDSYYQPRPFIKR